MPFTIYRALFFLIIMFFGPSWLYAGPMLVCDPYSKTELQPTKFVVEIDGKSQEVDPVKSSDGRLYLRYDLGQIADGVHTARIKAVRPADDTKKSKGSTESKESAWVSISFRKTGSEVTRIKDESEKLAPTRTLKGYLKDEK